MSAVAAMVAGGLRIASTFISYQADAAWLEALYGLIDLCFLVGLVGVYVATAAAVGAVGLAGFLIALAGVASIVGPDATAFGVDFYRVGALVFVGGLAVLAAALLRAGMLRVSAALWVVTFVAALAAGIVSQAFMVAGVCLGAGFVLAGVQLWKRSVSRADRSV